MIAVRLYCTCYSSVCVLISQCVIGDLSAVFDFLNTMANAYFNKPVELSVQKLIPKMENPPFFPTCGC